MFQIYVPNIYMNANTMVAILTLCRNISEHPKVVASLVKLLETWDKQDPYKLLAKSEKDNNNGHSMFYSSQEKAYETVIDVNKIHFLSTINAGYFKDQWQVHLTYGLKGF